MCFRVLVVPRSQDIIQCQILGVISPLDASKKPTFLFYLMKNRRGNSQDSSVILGRVRGTNLGHGTNTGTGLFAIRHYSYTEGYCKKEG